MWMLMIIAGYLLGSIPFGLLIARSFCGIDPRTEGSRNIGATNVARLCGMQWGIVAMLMDMAKGFLPTYVARLAGADVTLVSLVAFAALLGHVYSVFLKFNGGKAVATTLGIYAALAPLHCLGAAAVCVVVIAVSGYVSLGSLSLVTALPMILAVFDRPELAPLAVAVAVLVFWRHRENIRRLRRGEEKSWRKGERLDAPAEEPGQGRDEAS